MSTGELVDDTTPRWAGTPSTSAPSEAAETAGFMSVDPASPYLEVITAEMAEARRAANEASEDQAVKDQAAVRDRYVSLGRPSSVDDDPAAAALAVEQASSVLAAARDRLAHAENAVEVAAAAELLLLDRLAGGDESVSSTELVGAQAANTRAGLLRNAAKTSVSEADDAHAAVRLVEIEIQARALATCSDLAELEAARQAVIDAEKHRDTLQEAWSGRVQAMGQQLRDAGFPMINSATPVEQAGWVGFRPQGQVFGFQVDGQAFRVRSTIQPEDVFGRRP